MDPVAFTFLDGAVHDFQKLGLVALDGATTGTKRDERGLLASQDRIRSAIDTNHEALNSCGAEADQA